MSSALVAALHVLLLVILLVDVCSWLGNRPSTTTATGRGRRLLRPRTPEDCPHCREVAAAPLAVASPVVVPYTQLKSCRGRRKTLHTRGFAGPHPDCRYFNNPDPAVHALVGYTCTALRAAQPVPSGRVVCRRGHPGGKDRIQDFYCQACQHKFTARRHTAWYRLKTPAAQVAQVLHALAEGLSLQATARVFALCESTVRTWLTRAGLHARTVQDRFLRALHLTHVQLDELRFKLRGVAEAAWLPAPGCIWQVWIACDAQTKLIPSFCLGPRTQALAHQLAHDLTERLAPGCVPIFASDGLALYFYALTAHFGQWVQEFGKGRRQWVVAAELLAKRAQVLKRYRRKRVTEVRWQIQLGTLAAYRQALRTLGLTGRIQIHPERSRRTAFVERLNLTFRRSIAGLARRSWSLPCSLGELALHFNWWRVYYHFVRPHGALCAQHAVGDEHGGRRRHRTRLRTPAQAAGLTDHRWTVLELLTFPAPAMEAG